MDFDPSSVCHITSTHKHTNNTTHTHARRYLAKIVCLISHENALMERYMRTHLMLFDFVSYGDGDHVDDDDDGDLLAMPTRKATAATAHIPPRLAALSSEVVWQYVYIIFIHIVSICRFPWICLFIYIEIYLLGKHRSHVKRAGKHLAGVDSERNA